MSLSNVEKIEFIKKNISSYNDFPKSGVIFKDIFSILRDPDMFSTLYDVLCSYVESITPAIQCVVALESRGFLFGPILALHLKVPFVPIRKKGKLPGKTKSFTYTLEYGQDTIEVQDDSIKKDNKVLIIDDLLATGGSLSAACELINTIGADVIQCLVIIELRHLNGRSKIPVPVDSIIEY